MSLETRSLVIAELDVEDPASVDASYEVARAATAEDVPDFPPPCPYEYAQKVRLDWPGSKAHHYVARLDGAVAGSLEVKFTLDDNLDNAWIELNVHPAYRRRGVGRALFEHGCDVARANGRTRVMTSALTPREGVSDRGAASASFAKAVGLTAALGEIRRRLDLTTLDHPRLERDLAEAWTKADGYSTVRWIETPEHLLEGVAALDSSFLGETPLEDLALEPSKIDADKVRQMERMRERYGITEYSTGVVHDATGQLVAWTQYTRMKTVDWHVWQGITLVHPQHRGHRLGLICKLENLAYLLEQEPRVRVTDTWNAAVNQHMIAINEQMGFKIVDAWGDYQRDL
jgi:GNAT superfamily N-acetyltransferase